MKEKILNKRKNKAQLYEGLLTIDWVSLNQATNILTSYLIDMESDQMKIEFVFMELFKTVNLLKNQGTQIASDIAEELIDTYTKNANLVVPLSAFLLTREGSNFWMKKCSDRYKQFFLSTGWIGIVYFCLSSDIPVQIEMYDCFVEHLLHGDQIIADPFYYWLYKRNCLTDVARRILSIPCSESPVERLFGGLSFMIDPSSNKMKDDLIDAEMTIRMSTVFKNHHYFDGKMLQKLEKSYEYLCTNSFPDIMDLFK
ncbi:hypothetical protein M9Y10_016365 [Tritrichomonas musculus]